MKKTSNRFLHVILKRGLCLMMLSCVCFSPAFAQDATEDADSADAAAITIYNKRKAENEKAQKQYEMQTVKGLVTDNATGQPLGGVRIQALGYEKYSVLTEEDGTYSISVPTFVHTLYLVVPGYVPQQLAIKKDRDMNTSMISDVFNSYYTDGTTITAKASAILDQTSSITVETDIENKLAGSIHSISRSGLPGQGTYMTIRGINSLNANAQPLIVIDGNIIDPEYERTSLHEGFYNNLLSGLDPENVESIEVLKNGTALYGAKGGNGVIVIKTKRGKSMTTKINVRLYGGTELTPKKLDMLNGHDYRTYLGDLTSTVKDVNVMGSNSGISNVNWAFLNDNPSNYYYKVFHNDTDWQKDMYRNTFVQNYKINVEGGDEIGMYSLSLGYTKADATQKGTDFSRLNLRFNTDIKIASKLTTGLDIAYNQTAYNVLDNGWSEDYDMQNIGSTNVLGLIQSPMISPYAYYHDDAAGQLLISKEYSGKYASGDNTTWVQNPFKFPQYMGINESLRNPYWVLQNGKGKNKNYAELTQININVSPKYQITKQFSISDRFNYQLNRNNEKYFLPIAGTTQYMLNDRGYITSVLKSQFTKETTINNDLRLEWKNSYGAHNIDVFGGWRYNNFSYSYSYMRGYNNENDKLPNLSKNMQYINYGGTKDNWIDMTYYLDASYNYAHKYFADFTISSQSSSKFGNNTKDGFQLGGVSWGVFPSLQLGWIISNEDWFKTGRGINYLKLTAGVDQSGNDDLDYYAARTYWESQQVTKTTVGLVLSNIENSTIQWETVTKWNVGLEGSFLKNRLHAGIDLFRHNVDNLLTIKDLHYVSGMQKYWTNEGSMRNTGFEFNVNAALINKKDWKWEVGATLGHYNNEITSLPSENKITLTDANGKVTKQLNGYTSSIYGTENVLTAVGYAAGSFFGWQTNGILANDADASQAGAMGYLKYPTGLSEDPYRNFLAGDVRFVDQNGDGVIDDADKVVIGNPNPDIYGNIYTSLTWKNLRLDVNFKYSLGNDVYNYQRSMLESMNTTYNQTTAVLSRWTYENQQTSLPKVCYIESDDWRNNERMSDRWIEDGSYLKLKNVRLTYNLPYSNSWLQGLKIWAEGNNLWTITKYLGTDPEMSSRNSSLYQGIDTGLIPSGRSFNLGLSINL
ncbi:MAG: SusC/RagA family TonB-linked outer membrane protein [Bacteroidaceae bacterium]|nr:SusC/RagA family TonB-linked outer membrane protein [Bacteroidaceae bacterium]